MPYFFGQLIFWNNPELIHPDDLPKLKAKYHGLAFIFYEEIRRFENYLIIRILPDGESFWVREDAIKNFSFPKFGIGDFVQTKTEPSRNGWIRSIDWHFKKAAHIYFLEVENKIGFRRKSKCRYFEQDLDFTVEQ